MSMNFELGAKVEVNYEGRGKWYPGKISRVREGTCDAIWGEYSEGRWEEMTFDKAHVRSRQSTLPNDNDDAINVKIVPQEEPRSSEFIKYNASKALNNSGECDYDDDDDGRCSNGGYQCQRCNKEYKYKKIFDMHVLQCKAFYTQRHIKKKNTTTNNNNNKVNSLSSSSNKNKKAATEISLPESSNKLSVATSSYNRANKLTFGNKHLNTAIDEVDDNTTINVKKVPRLESQPSLVSNYKVSKVTLAQHESLYVNNNGISTNVSTFHVNLLVRRLNNVSGKYHWLMNNNVMSLKIQDGGLIVREKDSFTLIADFPRVCIEKLLVITNRIVRIIITENSAIIAHNNKENSIAIQYLSDEDQTSFMSYFQTNSDVNCYVIDSDINSKINDNFNRNRNETNDIDYIRSHFVNPNVLPSPYGISLVDLNDKSIQAFVLLLLVSEEFADFTRNLEDMIEQNMTRLPSKRRGGK